LLKEFGTVVVPVRSDVDAKAAFIKELARRGYTARVTAHPADISATRGPETHYFEIKKTGKETNYFGAATLTEWKAALDREDAFWFVVAFQRAGEWEFHEYTPAEFMEFNSIPPFKIYFQIPIGAAKATPVVRTTRSVRLTRDRISAMVRLFSGFQGA
jgi:hypothetical protein